MAYIEREVERSVPELKAFNLLKKAEIQQIIKERTYYADRKFKYSRHDCLRYIQFETKLFRLVMLRSQARTNLDKNDIVSIRKRFISRINSIYNIALSRFSNDKQLWLLSFDFAKRHSERISRAKFLKALLLHPHWIDAWINAAQYEYEWNKNATNARLLYQRAISLNTKSLSLYLSFFKMEILVIKQHLNWNFDKIDNESFNWKKELKSLKKNGKNKNNEWFDRIYSEMELPKLIMRNAMKNMQEKKAKHVLIQKMLLMIPTKKDLIADASIFKDKTHMNEDEINEKLEKITLRFNELQNYIFQYLEKNYYFDCVFIELLARKNIQIYYKNNGVLSRCVEISGCQVFERAILLLSIEKKESNEKHIIEIVNQYIKYIKTRMDFYVKLKENIVIQQQEELNKNDLYLLQIYENVTKYLVLRLVDSFNKLHALSANAVNELLFKQWIQTLTQINKFDEALELSKLATNQYPKCVNLWKLCSDLYARQLSICEERKERNKYYKKAIQICTKGIQCVSVVDAPQLWLTMIDIMMAQLMFMSLNNVNNEDNDDEDDSDSDSDLDLDENDNLMKEKQMQLIHDTFRKAIEECLSNNDELKESYLRYIISYHSADKTKILETLKWFDRQTMKCSPKIYKNILDIYESILLFDVDMNHKQQRNIEKIARLYEKCVNEHGEKKANVWIWYIEYARKYMKISIASSIYQRAMKTLNSEAFQVFVKYANKTK